ncbi:hypothetical protein VE25_02085 [Devosia geojensis]|uniref:Zinc finger/thioredoxin putative domain-containing protein n=1 Tax=Devosia geojensis TaxID=443610 RepID=A0A0F5FXW7_9HYPH|nr:zinc-ribbon domain-containing protein [Devosia geojensis]KKB13420.1 hypothetical protein VE25_02085 [Devosia geojensis]
MIITCPHCSTRYQVAYEAIGAAGRKVQCAACRKDWQERPPEADPETEAADQLFDSIAEDGLDEAMVAEERSLSARIEARLAVERAKAEAAEAPVPAPAPADAEDPTTLKRRQRAFSKRRKLLNRDLPMARLRRIARMGVLVALVGLVAGLYLGRAPMVRQFPQLAGLYAALGLDVNVVGLDFAGLQTRRLLREGREVLDVGAEIVGLDPRAVTVPSVVVALTDAEGAVVYQWSVAAPARTLVAGERARIETQLPAPPPEAVGVRLSFAGAAPARQNAGAV